MFVCLCVLTCFGFYLIWGCFAAWVDWFPDTFGLLRFVNWFGVTFWLVWFVDLLTLCCTTVALLPFGYLLLVVVGLVVFASFVFAIWLV